jgi:hypothetical protein
MPECAARLRDATAVIVIVTPNTAKIDADDDCINRPQIKHSRASRCPVCRTYADRKRDPSGRSHHCSPFRTRSASALVRGDRLCFPGFSQHRRYRLLSRIRSLPSRSDYSRPSTGCNCFHTDVRLVRGELVLASMEEGLKHSRQFSVFSRQDKSSAVFDFLTTDDCSS